MWRASRSGKATALHSRGYHPVYPIPFPIQEEVEGRDSVSSARLDGPHHGRDGVRDRGRLRRDDAARDLRAVLDHRLRGPLALPPPAVLRAARPGRTVAMAAPVAAPAGTPDCPSGDLHLPRGSPAAAQLPALGGGPRPGGGSGDPL